MLDCHPPSKIATNSLHTSAIKLPCKNTLALLLFSLIMTVVLDPDQLTLFLIAVFICISILRIVKKSNRVNRIVYKLVGSETKKEVDLLNDCGCECYTLVLNEVAA